MQFLGRDAGKPIAEIEAGLGAKDGIRARAGAIGFENAFVSDESEQIQVLAHKRIGIGIVEQRERHAKFGRTIAHRQGLCLGAHSTGCKRKWVAGQ